MMTTYEPLPDKQLYVGALAYARVGLLDAQQHDLSTYWTAIIVLAVWPDKVEVSPIGSSSVAQGMTECLSLMRNIDGHIPLYRLKKS